MAPGMFFYAECDERQLLSCESPCRVSCFMCDKPLGSSADIFMYRGDIPFCSTECRQEQVEMDEAEKRRRKKRSVRMQTNSKPARSSTVNKSVQTGTIQVS